MKETPIIFSTPMVKAILDGRKTQTRRVVNPQFNSLWGQGVPRSNPNNYCAHVDIEREDGSWKWIRCPYGKAGDLLWVREAFGVEPGRYIQPSINTPYGGRFEDEVFYRADDESLPGMKWKPSIHMFKKYARIWLEITSIRVERLQDITEEDAQAEGCKNDVRLIYGNMAGPIDYEGLYAVERFETLWDSIHKTTTAAKTVKKDGEPENVKYPWDSNPWVWVISFKRVRAPGNGRRPV